MVLLPCEIGSATSPDIFVHACGEPDDTTHISAVAVADDDVVDAAGRAMLAHDAPPRRYAWPRYAACALACAHRLRHQQDPYIWQSHDCPTALARAAHPQIDPTLITLGLRKVFLSPV